MKKEDIERLATLARIELTETEAVSFAEDISSILGYVSEIKDITGGKDAEKVVGALYNVMREDGEPHAGGLYTEDLLDAAPEREGQYVKVKKILESSK
jgi:aspartyl-tRNA(Asn)/glutamyl-tRNA(Gln) amidotransferase subunit C